MSISPLAGKPAPKEMLVDPVRLEREYYARRPDIECVGYGGPLMAAAGCDVHADLTALAVMWLLRALLNIHKFLALAARVRRPGELVAPVTLDAAPQMERHAVPVVIGVPRLRKRTLRLREVGIEQAVRALLPVEPDERFDRLGDAFVAGIRTSRPKAWRRGPAPRRNTRPVRRKIHIP